MSSSVARPVSSSATVTHDVRGSMLRAYTRNFSVAASGTSSNNTDGQPACSSASALCWISRPIPPGVPGKISVLTKQTDGAAIRAGLNRGRSRAARSLDCQELLYAPLRRRNVLATELRIGLENLLSVRNRPMCVFRDDHGVVGIGSDQSITEVGVVPEEVARRADHRDRTEPERFQGQEGTILAEGYVQVAVHPSKELVEGLLRDVAVEDLREIRLHDARPLELA